MLGVMWLLLQLTEKRCHLPWTHGASRSFTDSYTCC